jgi:hypothetical protein
MGNSQCLDGRTRELLTISSHKCPIDLVKPCKDVLDGQIRVMKCSARLAILLEITANLYVHRREIRHSKRGQARRQRRQRRQATERPNRLRRQHGEKTGSVGCVWPQRASSAGRKRAPWRQWGLRSRGARITRVWPLNKMLELLFGRTEDAYLHSNTVMFRKCHALMLMAFFLVAKCHTRPTLCHRHDKL